MKINIINAKFKRKQIIIKINSIFVLKNPLKRLIKVHFCYQFATHSLLQVF